MIEKRSGADRRRFFRIDDRLQLAVHRLPGADEGAGAGGDFGADEFLAGIDRGIAAIIAAARVQAPAVGELAQLLNRKLDYVIERLGQLEAPRARPPLAEHEVSISACGLGLQSAERYETGETLQVELMFPPAAPACACRRAWCAAVTLRTATTGCSSISPAWATTTRNC